MSYNERRIMECHGFGPRKNHETRRLFRHRIDPLPGGNPTLLRSEDHRGQGSWEAWLRMSVRIAEPRAGAVLDELRKWDWAPRSVHKNYRRITRITAVLTEQLEREPTPKELADALGIEMSELNAFQTMALPRRLLSLDETHDQRRGEEGHSLAERLADFAMPRPDAQLLTAEERHELVRCLNKLPKSQLTIIVLHYLKEIPLREVAAMLAVTPSRVSQLHHQALSRLKLLLQRTRAVF